MKRKTKIQVFDNKNKKIEEGELVQTTRYFYTVYSFKKKYNVSYLKSEFSIRIFK